MTILFPYIGGSWPESGGGGGGSDIKDIIGNPLIGVVNSDGVVYLTPKTYVHEQGVASDTWEITHNLNKFPTVVLVDSAGTTFGAAVTYNSSNKCTIQMNGATTGKAYLN
jgi:hypothetical protein